MRLKDAEMERFWIVKEARDGRNNTKGTYGTMHDSREKADDCAASLAGKERSRYIVFEAVAAFEPTGNVQEVKVK